MARTAQNVFSGARNNLLGSAAIRYVGFVTAFFGIMHLLLGSTVIDAALKLIGVIMLLIGVLLCSGNLKLLFGKSTADDKKKGAIIYFFIGILLIILGVLLIVLLNNISKYVNLIIGILIAFYGLLILINSIVSRRKNKFWFTMDLIVSLLVIASGVLLALLFTFTGHTYVLVTGIIATTAGGLAMLLY